MHADPYDYGRYTDRYWQSVLSELGFSEIMVEPQGGFYSVMLSFAKQYLNQVRVPRPFGRVSRFFVSRLLVFPLQQWTLRVERSPRVCADSFLSSFTTGFGIRAVK
jgi:hypothetical protein